MGDYTKNNKESSTINEVKIIEKSSGIDINELANAVAKAISISLPINKYNGSQCSQGSPEEDIINRKTLEKLAKSMIVQREIREDELKNFGKVNESKKDINETNKTIDLLSNLED